MCPPTPPPCSPPPATPPTTSTAPRPSTAPAGSWLAKHTDAFLFAGVKAEGGPLNRAPRNSVLAELLTLQALSVALQVEKDWDPVKYVRCHPGGKLGELRENEK